METTAPLKHVTLYTDGACSGNPGPGGWAAVLSYAGHQKELSGSMGSTTNNRMELFAVISGLGALKTRCRVSVYSDSTYVVDAINQAYENAERIGNDLYAGITDDGIEIDMYLTSKGKITTAYPVRED